MGERIAGRRGDLAGKEMVSLPCGTMICDRRVKGGGEGIPGAEKRREGNDMSNFLRLACGFSVH